MEIKNKSIFAKTIKDSAEKIKTVNYIDKIQRNQLTKDIIKYSVMSKGKEEYYKTEVEIDFSSQKMVGARCTCPYQFYCKHEYALILSINEQEKNRKKIKEESLEDRNIVQVLNEQILAELFDLKPKYRLIPEYEYDGLQMKVGFKVEVLKAKTYIIGNIYDLAHNFKYRQQATYGKATVIEHKYEFFETPLYVEAIMNLIEKTERTILATENDGYSKIGFQKKVLPITIKEFVELMNYMIGKTIYFSNKKLYFKTYKIEEKTEKIKVIIEDNSNGNFFTLKTNIDKKEMLIEKSAGIIIEKSSNGKNFNLLKIQKFNSKYSSSFLKEIYNKEILITSEELYDFQNNLQLELEKDFEIIGNNIILEETAQLIIEINAYKNKVTIEKYIQNISLNSELELIYNKKKEHLVDNVLLEYPEDKTKEMKTKQKYNSKKYTLKNSNDIFTFVDRDLVKLEQLADKIIGNDEFNKIEFINEFELQTNVNSTANGIELQFLATEFSIDELQEIIKEYEKKSVQYYRLKSGKYLNLNQEKIVELEKLISKLDISLDMFEDNKILIDKHRGLYLEKLMQELNLNFNQDVHFQEMLRDFHQYKEEDFIIPKTVKADLREYQKDGYNWLKFLEKHGFNGILADDMGLGKTLQVITVLSDLPNGKKSLIVVPSSLIINWKKELEKFNPTLLVLLVNGSKEEREKVNEKFKNYDIIITSYDLLKRDINIFLKEEYHYVILDEAQHVKNSKTQGAKAVKLLKSKHKLALTGTPIENSISELWSVFDFLMPGYLLNKNQFTQKFEKPIIKENNQKKLNDLKNMTDPFILRRLKKNVLKDLPAKNEQIIYVELGEHQRRIYDMNVIKMKKILNNKNEIEINQSKIEILSYITKLRQLCCNPQLVDASYPATSAKLEVVKELLLELKESGHKAIVFSQFVSNFDYLKEMFEQERISYSELTGKTNKNKRHELVEKFNNDRTDVFLISLKAGGTGLNIIGANTVIHYDPWWNSSAENQATDRAHRIGQKKEVNVYKLIAENTIEAKIIEIQKEKNKIAEAILGNNKTDLKKMTKNDLINLFGNEKN